MDKAITILVSFVAFENSVCLKSGKLGSHAWQVRGVGASS
jgi:hypothetical protein